MCVCGLEAVEGYLSTTVDLTKQVKPSFALPPLLGGRVAVKRQQNRRKEGGGGTTWTDHHKHTQHFFAQKVI